MLFICDFTYSCPYHFHKLSPPAYTLVVVFIILLSDNLLIKLSILVTPLVFLISCRTALSSEATMFSSITPSLILFSMFFINASSLIIFPAPKISSIVILRASVTDDLPPMCPFANGNMLADVTLRTCVAGDKTVLPNCVATFNCNMFLYTLFCIQLSSVPGVPFNACDTCLDPNNLDISLLSKPRPFSLPIGLSPTSKIPLLIPSSLDPYNQPSSLPTLANLSIIFLLVACVIACDVVCNTEDFKLFSSPNNLLIAVGNSSPVFKIWSDLKSYLEILCNIDKGSASSCLPDCNIFLTNASA